MAMIKLRSGADFATGSWRSGIRIAFVLFWVATASGQEIEQAPIRYSAAVPRNGVVELRGRLEAGTSKLEHDPDLGYLRPLLRELDIPESSQVLVFSKTSLQRERISPKTPRAIYFNDGVFVGFCQGGTVLEISTADDTLGTVFYTIDQALEEKPVPVRQTESCLLCHSSSANQGIPGHLVRSLSVDRQGQPLYASRSFRTDHSSPLPERWGGWYVTGTSGGQSHMGNMISRGRHRTNEDDAGTHADGLNLIDLKDRIKTSSYPTPHSDIVALMVLEHQVGMLNRIARAGIETRMALNYEAEFNKMPGRSAGQESESARSRIRGVGDSVVRYLLFQNEARLTGPIRGTSSFAADFARRGPRDSKGRSLRDFDLETRLFRYPCSYLIDSRAFDTLPVEVTTHVYRRLWEILNGKATGKDDPLLAEDDRRAILEILRETKPGLPEYWKPTTAASH